MIEAKRDIIPIVGYEALRYKETNSGMVIDDIVKHVLDMLVSEYKKINPMRPELSQAITIYEQKRETAIPNDLLNILYKPFQSSFADRSRFKTRFKQIVSDIYPSQLTDYNNSLRKLVQIEPFKIFVNATCTDQLKRTLQSYRFSSADAYGFKRDMKGPNEFAQNETQYHLEVMKNECAVYNLVDTYLDPDPILVDTDYQELIWRMITKREERYKNFLGYLSSAHLLFIGCNFRDWFLRFFLRIWLQKRLDDETNKLKVNAVIDRLNSSEAFNERPLFISNFGITTFEMDCHTFIDKLHFKLAKKESNLVTPESLFNYLFVSHAKEDREIAKGIVRQLDAESTMYWFDEEVLNTPGPLDQRLASAIEKACAFIVVVSDHVLNKEGKTLWEEWDAIKRSRKPVFLVYPTNFEIGQFGNAICSMPQELRAYILSRGGNKAWKLDEHNKMGQDLTKQIRIELGDCGIKSKKNEPV